jgi:ABC transporter DrrB family efflux protein
MFLLIFRFVFGGAIRTGGATYIDLLIPGLVAVSGLFAGGAVGIATDAQTGMLDRLRSLPIARPAVLAGRSIADSALTLWSATITIGVGLAVGFRPKGNPPELLAAIALCVAFAAAFTWIHIFIGLAARTPQAAQALAFSVFPLVFVSSAYVPVASLPTWLRPIASAQPVTTMVDAVRSLTLGSSHLDHASTWYITRSLTWAVAITIIFATLSIRRFTDAE